MTTMATFHFDLVSPEKLAFSGEVDQVDVPGVEGDFGVLAGHAPLVAMLRPGILTVYAGGEQSQARGARRLRRSRPDGLTVLADVATRSRISTAPRSQAQIARWKRSRGDGAAPRSTARSPARSFQGARQHSSHGDALSLPFGRRQNAAS